MSNKKNLANEEWDFRSCPKNELKECLCYELAREVWYLLKKNPEEISHLRLSCLKKPQTRLELSLNLTNSALLAHFKEWPRKPWLCISPEKRKEYLKTLSEDSNGLIWKGLFQNDPMGMLHHNIEDEEKKVRCTATYFTLKIDWSLSDKSLIGEFKKLLEEHRQSKPLEQRGRTSILEMLKKLGAYRLLNVYAWDKAEEITQKILPLVKEQPTALYNNQASWLKVKSETEKAIKHFAETSSIEEVLLFQKSLQKNLLAAKETF